MHGHVTSYSGGVMCFPKVCEDLPASSLRCKYLVGASHPFTISVYKQLKKLEKKVNSLMKNFAKDVSGGPTITMRSGESHVISSDVLIYSVLVLHLRPQVFPFI